MRRSPVVLTERAPMVIGRPHINPNFLMTKNLVVLGLLALVMTATSADAQKKSSARPIELGLDGGISVGFDNPNVTTVSLPVQALRVGFFMNDNLSLEPRFNFNS